MRRTLLALTHLLLLLALGACTNARALPQPAAPYFPPKGDWTHHKPSEEGMDDDKLAAAIAWAQTQETDWPKDFSKQQEIFGKPLGPVPTTRAATNGLVLRHGYIVAQFGDTQ